LFEFQLPNLSKKSVEKYNGNLKSSTQDNVFSASILLF